MGTYKLVIANAIGGEELKTVEFEENIQEDAKARIYRILLTEAADFVDGEYTGRLLRKGILKSGWEEVNGAPLIACKVEAGNASLTVERVVYGKESQQLNRLLAIHAELGNLKKKYLACLNSKNVIPPLPVMEAVKEIIQIIETLHSDYDPEYLQAPIYPDVIDVFTKISSAIQGSYDSYAKSATPDYYTTEVAKQIGEIQLSIQSILGQLKMQS